MVRAHIPILTIVLNNSSMAVETKHMKTSHDMFKTRDLRGNYSDIAKAMGGWSERVTHPGEIKAAIGIALLRSLQLLGNRFPRRTGMVFHGAHADLGPENHLEQAVLINVRHQHAVLLPLLIDAVEIGFVDEICDGLVGQVSAGSQGCDGREIELPGVALVGDKKPALVNDQRRCGFGLLQQLAQCIVELLDVFLDELRQSGHVMRIAEFPD